MLLSHGSSHSDSDSIGIMQSYSSFLLYISEYYYLHNRNKDVEHIMQKGINVV